MTLRPVYDESIPAPGTARSVSVSGPYDTLFSETSPKSRTSVGFLTRARLAVSTNAQNSSCSTRERSTPVGLSDWLIERHRRPPPCGRCHRYLPVVLCRSPPIRDG